MHFLRIRSILVAIGGLAMAFWFGQAIGEGNTGPPIMTAMIATAVWFLLSIRRTIIALLTSIPLTGRLFSVPFGPTPFELSMAMLVPQVTLQIMLKKMAPRFGSPWIVFPAAGILAILTFHFFAQGTGARVLGAESVGARFYLDCYLGLAAYLILASANLDLRDLRPFAICALVPAVIVGGIDVLLFLKPNLTGRVYALYSQFTWDAAGAYLGQGELIRIGGLRDLGIAILLVMLSYRRVNAFWNRDCWWTVPLGIFSLGCMFAGGFRSYLMLYGLILALFSLLDLRWRAFIPAAILVVVVLLVAAGHSHLYELPRFMQRPISFLPGDWDPEVKWQAGSTVDWRAELWAYFFKWEFPAQPWFGRGLGFKMDEMGRLSFNPLYYGIGPFVEMRMWHSGLVSALDATGIIGTIFWIATNVGCFIVVMRGLRALNSGPQPPALRFLVMKTASLLFFTAFTGNGLEADLYPLLTFTGFLEVGLRKSGQPPGLPPAIAREAGGGASPPDWDARA